ncbi:MAG: preprotein translocase subunit SecE [Firmicutes bacterium]|nr:preprotein translocase subunit SecE [Bacillota bacterium]
MAKKKRDENQGGLQQAKLSVEEKEDLKAEKAKMRAREDKVKAKKEKSERPGFFRRIGTGFRNMFGELKKVRWPTFARTVKQTGVVLAVVLIFSLVIFGFDRGLAALYGLLVEGLGGS